MPANFSRLKDWTAEVLTYEDLNAEIDNILNHLNPNGVGDYSVNLAQMQETTDPFPSDIPSLANSLAGELERLRFQIQQIMGSSTANWYEDPPVTLTDLNDTVFGGGLPNSRLDSGTTGSDGLIRALRPETGSNGVAVLDASAPFVYYINGVKYEQLSDVTVSGFSGAPTTNNTALVNNAVYADQQYTRYLGQYETFIPLDTVGAEITALTGKLAGFKINNGTATEYFIGQYQTLPSPGIYKARRQNFFDYQGVPIESVAFSDNDTVTLCRLAWLFISTNGTLSASYNTPVWSATQPASPDLGDYWYSFDDTNWRIYTPAGWSLSSALLIGQVILDGTLVKGARTVDRFQVYDAVNEIDIEVNPANTAELRMANYGGRISVYSQPFEFGFRNPTWTGANLEGGAGSLANSTTYYAYIEDDATFWLSVTPPTERLGDLLGYYHPSNAWRCVGYCTTSGAGALLTETLISFTRTSENSFFSNGKERPVVQKFTVSGTYRPTIGTTRIKVEVRGAGGGGQGSSTATWGPAGGNGGNTTFGTGPLITAGGGGGGNVFPAANQTGSVDASVTNFYIIPGETGGPGLYKTTSGAAPSGKGGGNGGARAILGGSGGEVGVANSGGGGSGGALSDGTAGWCGAGGGEGGFVVAYLTNLAPSYTVTIGAAGTAGAAGASGNAGGTGTAGNITITEY